MTQLHRTVKAGLGNVGRGVWATISRFNITIVRLERVPPLTDKHSIALLFGLLGDSLQYAVWLWRSL